MSIHIVSNSFMKKNGVLDKCHFMDNKNQNALLITSNLKASHNGPLVNACMQNTYKP